MDQNKQPSAIERLEALEKGFQLFNEKADLLAKNQEALAKGLNQLSDAVPQLAKSLDSVITRINELSNLGYQASVAANRIESVSSLVGMVSEYLYATVGVLRDSNLVDPEKIGDRVLQVKAEKRLEQEKALLEQGLIRESQEGISQDSFFALQEEKDGKLLIVRDHLNAAQLDEETKAVFIGKKEGETADYKGRSLKILKVFEPVLEGKLSDTEPQPQQQQ